MADARRVDQLYVLLYRMNDNPPPLPAPEAEMMNRHRAFLQGLLDRRLMFGSGATKDETGARHAAGLIIVRTKTLAEAKALAADEPFCKAGQRRVEVIPWQRSWFGE
jgi:uncharacterized protein YciI